MANKLNGEEFFDNTLDDNEHDQIIQMLEKFKSDKNIEFEVSFYGISYANYMRISQYYVDSTDESNISSQTSLDISILLADNNTYRVSILGLDEIDAFISKFARSSVMEIQKYLLSVKPDVTHEIMYKDRGSAQRLNIKDIGLVFKITNESNSKNIPKLTGAEKMTYRYKARSSFVINKYARLDITDVQQSNVLWNLATRPSNYEIELEFIHDGLNISKIFNLVAQVLSVVQDSPIPVGRKETSDVVNSYRTLLAIKPSNHLESRNVISVESQHIVKFIPNKYAVTDKADGERYFMIILENGIYLISTNLTVKKTLLDAPDKKFYKTILDGELIQIVGRRQGMFLAFDVVYSAGIDYRTNEKYTLTVRLEVLDNIIDKCFGTLIPFTDYLDKYNDMEISLVRKFYTKELKSYWQAFNKALDKSEGLFVSRKKYFVPYGIDSAEVFMYADLLWKLCVYDKLTPYNLDGIIYTPIGTPYMINVGPDKYDTLPLEYKWKNPSQNSIDFYIKFETDGKTETIYYDNDVAKGAGRPYKICTLFVGLVKGGQEKPIPFKVNNIVQKAYIYLTDNEARDVSGNIINDATVVEFIFDNSKTDIEDPYKWIALRTRYDKTESVQKYGRKYGNNLAIAIRIWKTIVNPVTEEIIASLANPATFQKELDRLSKSNESYQGQSFVYYQKKTSTATGMRAFNNWIKSNMILTYCYEKPSVLDIGCGRGGDLIKFIHAKVGEYVGVDIDNNGLYVINESAFSRYKNLKRTIKNIPPMYFIQADAKGLFNVKSQQSILPNMNQYNKTLIETHLSGSKKYNIVNCQFTLHYYLSDELAWNNFCANLDNCLDDNGYFLVTCFDGQLLYDKLKDKQKMIISYTDTNGKKNIFSEIVKIYADNESSSSPKKQLGQNSIGMAVDVYNSIISNPGTYIREYLVFPEFLESSLKEKCGLELVESDSFFNLFNLYKNYFIGETTDKLSLVDTSDKRYADIRQFYLTLMPGDNSVVETDAALASFKFTMLNRYYVFKKKTKINLREPARIVGLNHKINLGKVITPYFDTNNMIIDPAQKTTKINKIYHAIRKRYPQTKPAVYLIRHSINEDHLDNQVFRRNKLEFSRVKDGADPKVLLIYKSPEKYFYPIYYKYVDYDDSQIDVSRIAPQENRGTYLLESTKIIKDLDLLVALSEKMYG